MRNCIDRHFPSCLVHVTGLQCHLSALRETITIAAFDSRCESPTASRTTGIILTRQASHSTWLDRFTRKQNAKHAYMSITARDATS